ncbi:hypothetical protein CC1G_12461 [Coprinopsis cinerea okayama7|uniref:BED-type domain-containing protein n=1 Tax=Coprinopsis cinerea (strain Okayama-7 / 130 / ATCC MYA-4618 / FGSC 9003) TaxID=240176 RepID=A8NL01_COPC7|nr:hypothetical protein CC1G_12461 [Coprinopsis cinerea okayama7\|eukprot:XP_001834583.2 hypothetical protein CC1G_12461 [Coprinopsis cinerea okayama7\
MPQNVCAVSLLQSLPQNKHIRFQTSWIADSYDKYFSTRRNPSRQARPVATRLVDEETDPEPSPRRCRSESRSSSRSSTGGPRRGPYLKPHERRERLENTPHVTYALDDTGLCIVATCTLCDRTYQLDKRGKSTKNGGYYFSNLQRHLNRRTHKEREAAYDRQREEILNHLLRASSPLTPPPEDLESDASSTVATEEDEPLEFTESSGAASIEGHEEHRTHEAIRHKVVSSIPSRTLSPPPTTSNIATQGSTSLVPYPLAHVEDAHLLLEVSKRAYMEYEERRFGNEKRGCPIWRLYCHQQDYLTPGRV